MDWRRSIVGSPDVASGNRGKQCRIFHALLVPLGDFRVAFSINSLLIEYSVSRQISRFVRIILGLCRATEESYF